MLHFIENKLSEFRSCFSRQKSFNWFQIIVISLMVRYDSLGVTSFIRALFIKADLYETMLHFFRSEAFVTSHLKTCWHKLVHGVAPFIRMNGRILLLGDGTKVSKEARKMPGVKKLCQESEDSSKPQFIHGHMFGGVAAVIGNHLNSFAIPLDLNIQDGLKETALWNGGDVSNSLSHVLQMIQNGHDITRTFDEDCYLVLDRYFLTVPGLQKLKELNEQEGPSLDIITRAKNNCTAYEKPSAPTSHRRGRPAKKGKAIKLIDLFDDRSNEFITDTVQMYGKSQEVSYLTLNLLWGIKLYQELRFVLVQCGGSRAIFVSTDLSMEPTMIIESYAHRFKIECMFRELKQQIQGFNYHFWSKSMPKLNRFKKKNDPDQLSSVNSEHDRKKVLLAVDACERFVMCSEIAMGLLQLIALQPAYVEVIQKSHYLRTSHEGRVSEATVKEYLRNQLFRLISLNPHSAISQLILSMQDAIADDSKAA